MSKLFASLAVALAAATGLPCAAAPLEAYGRLPAIETVEMSPDGGMMAYSFTDGDLHRIFIVRTDAKRLVASINVGAEKIRRIQWAGANHLIMTGSSAVDIENTSAPKGEYSVAVDYNIARKSSLPLLTLPTAQQHLNAIWGEIQTRTISGHPFAFVQGVVFDGFGNGQFSLFKVNLETDLATVLSTGFTHTNDYLVASTGQLLAETEYEAATGRWTLKVWKQGGWREADSRLAPLDPPRMAGLGRDGLSVLIASPEEHRFVLRELSPEGGWSAPLPTGNLTELIWDRASGKLIGEKRLTGDDGVSEFFDPMDRRGWESVTKAYPGDRVSMVSFSDDHRKLVVHVDSPIDRPFFALADLDTKTFNAIGADYTALTAKDIAAVRPVTFKAADGLVLTGYLTLPAGKDAKKLPLVVFPHGGPATRDTPGFNWWAQAMASRGYAVLQVNYRGSEGFGWDLQSAGFGQWGRKMQTDLSDGVRFLAHEGVVDPSRVCVVGASYGGYAALAGAAIDAGVYRCAVSVAGPSDLGKMVGPSRGRSSRGGVAADRYWLRYMGDQASLSDVSPADHAEKVAIPILLIHGKDDTVVPYEQSQIMADALRRAGKPVEFATLRREDHWLSRGETRLQMLKATIAFLEKNNPP